MLVLVLVLAQGPGSELVLLVCLQAVALMRACTRSKGGAAQQLAQLIGTQLQLEVSLHFAAHLRVLPRPLGEVIGDPLGDVSPIRSIYYVLDCGTLIGANNIVCKGKTCTRGASQRFYNTPGVFYARDVTNDKLANVPTAAS